METIQYPAGEYRVTRGSKRYSGIDVRSLKSSQDGPVFDIMELALEIAVNNKWNHEIMLVMPYVPYAREDRASNDGLSPNSMKVFGNIINNMNFSSVEIFDPHSDVVESCIDNVVKMSMSMFFYEALYDSAKALGQFVVVLPDAGAEKKWYSYYQHQMSATRIKGVYACSKIRDPATGDIIGFTAPDDLMSLGDDIPIVVIDDICDGGRTFLELAKALPMFPKENMNLIVSHGIFSKGLDELFKYYGTIVTSDSIKQIDDRLKVIKI